MASPTSLQEQITALSTQIKSLHQQTLNDERSRKALLSTLQQAVQQVEAPSEAIWRWIMSPHQYAVLRTAAEMNLFNLVEEGEEVKASDLATKVGGDKDLVVRIMRPLCRMNVFTETDEELYAPGPVSSLLSKAPPLVGGLKFMFDAPATSLVGMPQFLKETGFKGPDSGIQGIFQHAMKTEDPMFIWMTKQPDIMASFQVFMSASRHNRKDWFDFYPVKERLLTGFDESTPLLVDVGGGKGHELQAFLDRFGGPAAKEEKLVLQDLPPVIDSIGKDELSSTIVRTAHDFFTPQPIKDTRTYYFRSIPHDWPDKEAIAILSQVAKVMKPGYSKMIINEWILPDKGAGLYPSLLDINMMTLFSGKERTEKQWKVLLDKCGLEITGIWKLDEENEGVIEAVLKT